MTDVAESSFFDRTLNSLRRAMFGLAARSELSADLGGGDIERLRQLITEVLATRGGEASARARAAALGNDVLALNETGRLRFFMLLAQEFGIDRERLATAVEAWRTAADQESHREAEGRMRQALVPRRVRLLTQFNALPQGVKFLVDLRAEVLRLGVEHPELKPVDADLKDLLVSWFDVGFLDLRRITWSAPASLLEKLIAYEAVHEIRSWQDLKNRLEPDRRCYAFFHPRMPEEPLIFVEIALVSGIADNVQLLLDEEAPAQLPDAADTAIFYSISNAQAGLAGVSFGDFLIKRVVDDLARDMPNLKTFATLSPIPGFRAWLAASAAAGESPFLPAEQKSLHEATGFTEPHAALESLLAQPGWQNDTSVEARLKPILMRLGAYYLVEIKRNGRAADRVAHFHLSNGARLERLNWLGDTSVNGLRQSAGLMVNYLYKTSEIERNHEGYRSAGRIPCSTTVKRLLAQ